VPVTKVDGLTILTKEEAKVKKMGTCQWIYKGRGLDAAMNLVKEAKELGGMNVHFDFFVFCQYQTPLSGEYPFQ
jgi:hypothetical protein